MGRSLFPVVCVRLPPELLKRVDLVAAARWNYAFRPRGARSAFIEDVLRQAVQSSKVAEIGAKAPRSAVACFSSKKKRPLSP